MTLNNFPQWLQEDVQKGLSHQRGGYLTAFSAWKENMLPLEKFVELAAKRNALAFR